MAPTVYLVSGANRGIGLGLVSALALRDDVIVFAGARNPSAAKDLHELVQKHPGKVHVVKLTSCDEAENAAAVTKIKEIARRLDVVIANAGISNFYGPALEVPVEQMRSHFDINVVGTLVLFQASYPLLKASTSSPKFITISSGAGSISRGHTMPPVTPYGASKAAVNYVMRRIHFENEGLICFPINPGGVATDMAQFAQEQVGNLLAGFKLMTVDESVGHMLKVIDNCTRDKEGGNFLEYDGGRWEW